MASLASCEKRCLAHVLKNQESSLKHNDSLSLILQILLDNCDLAHVGASQSFICYIAKSSNCRWRCRAFSVSPKNTKKKGPLAYQGLIFLAQLDAPTFSPSGVPVSKIANINALRTKEGFMSDQSVSEIRLRYPEWQVEYTEALLEANPVKLPDRLRAAEAAISKRLEFLAGESNHQEEQALKDALHTAQVLKDDRGAS